MNKTGKYSHRDFEPEPFEKRPGGEGGVDGVLLKYRPFAETGEQLITIKTDVIEVYISKSRPELKFWYSPIDNNDKNTEVNRFETDTNFKLVFNRILGYTDTDDNGLFNNGEIVYAGELSENVWFLSDVTYGETRDFGNYIEFQMSSVVDLVRHYREYSTP